MTFLSDDAIARLRNAAEEPDFSGTRYRLVGKIGRGGMGVVYEADDLELERRVAIKVLATELTTPDAAERMRREARIVARLEHPGIVPVHDVGVLADGRVFYAMKLVRGTRLDELRGVTQTELLRVFVRVCEAVAFAHANGVVHRDLKPENVMVGEFGAVLVMDWGVAGAAGERAAAGTPGFMAPEQECGEAVDARADVFALGKALSGVLRENGDSPRRLKAIIETASAIDKENRYATARELGDDIVRYLDAQPVVAYRENVAERAGRWLSRNRALIGVIVAYLIMRAIVFFWVRR